MNYHLCFSPTGGTRKVGEILASHLGGEFQWVDLCREIEPMQLKAQDICLVSVPSYGGRVPEVNVKRLGKISGNGAKAVLNCVYGNRHWEDTLTELQDVLEQQGFVCVCAVAAVAEHSIFRQFGAGRPDTEDAACLEDFAQKIRGRLQEKTVEKLILEGRHGEYKPYGGASMKPSANRDCTACGLCAKECPVGAIDLQHPQNTDVQTCIGCMRCVGLCPVHARDLDSAMMAERGEKLKAVLGGHKENYLFL